MKTIERHFFESSHGKSAADGLSAIVKNAATLAVTRRQVVIRNAEEFTNFCNTNLKQVGKSSFPSRKEKYKNSKRTFFYVQSNTINRKRPASAVKPVPKIMKIHSVKSTGNPYQILTQELSCFCSHCQYATDNECTNQLMIAKVQQVSLSPTEDRHAETSIDEGDPTASRHPPHQESVDKGDAAENSGMLNMKYTFYKARANGEQDYSFLFQYCHVLMPLNFSRLL